MKFLHISDTHLGYRQYGLLERENDFFDVFDEAIDIAIKENVDFIIHTGDFFHTSRPSNKTILDSLKILDKLNKHNIPIFCIPGNHDRGVKAKDNSPLNILEKFGLNLIEADVKEFNGIDIVGLKYLSKMALRKVKSLREVLEKLLKLSRNDYKILLLHQEFYPYFPESKLFLQDEIPTKFNYIGVGHYHVGDNPIKLGDNSYVVHIGSTEFTAYNQGEENKDKYVALVNLSTDGTDISYIPLKRRRDFIYSQLNDDNIEEEIDKIIRKIEEVIDKGKKQPIVILKGNFKNLDRDTIQKLLVEKGINEKNPNILHIKTLFNFLSESVDLSSVKIKSEDEIIKDVLKRYFEDDENLYTNILDLINLLKNLEDSEEVKRYINENREIIKDILN